MRMIDIPGVTSNDVRATIVSHHIELDYDDNIDNDQRIYESLKALHQYVIENDLEYISFKLNSSAGYYPNLLERLKFSYHLDHYGTTGCFEFFRLFSSSSAFADACVEAFADA